MLPGLLVSGAGVGLTLPALSSAAAASLPPGRFATGAAVLTMARQLGLVLGVAVLVAVLGDGQHVAFESAWTFMALTAGAAAVAGFGIGETRAPALAAAPARA
jgi:hypothetical protein